MKFRIHYFCTLATLTYGCGSTPAEKVTTSDEQALYRTAEKWPNGVINVCLSIPEWNVPPDDANTPVNEAEVSREQRRTFMKGVRGIVENSFSRYASIHFRGWQDCVGDPGVGWVAITVYDPNGPNCNSQACWSRSGSYDPSRTSGMELLLGSDDAVTIQHEFLHLLGYAHEFISPNFQEPLSWWDGTRWWAMGTSWCVAAHNAAAGSQLELTAGGNCHFGNSDIRWTFTPLNTERTLMQIRKTFTDLCVQMPAGGGWGSRLELGPCSPGEPRQVVDMTTLPRYKSGDLCFNVFGGNAYEGAAVGLWPCTGTLSGNEIFLNGGMLGACVADSDCNGGIGGSCVNGRCRDFSGIQVTQPDPQSMTAAAYGYANNDAYFSGRLSPFDVIGLQADYLRIAPGSLVGPGGRCLSVDSAQPWVGGRLVGNECQGTTQDTWSIFTNVQLLRNDFQGQTRCANVAGGVTSPTDFTGLITWGCSSNHVNSQFRMNGVLWQGMGNMCVAASAAAAGGQVYVDVCDATNTRQRWNFFKDGDMIQLSGTDLCLELTDGSIYYGARPTLAACTGAAQQHFGFVNGEINFGSLCFNVFGGQPNVGAAIGLWDGCQAGNYNEYFWIRGPVRGLDQCMAFVGDSAESGTPVGVHACTNTSATEDWDYHW